MSYNNCCQYWFSAYDFKFSFPYWEWKFNQIKKISDMRAISFNLYEMKQF